MTAPGHAEALAPSVGFIDILADDAPRIALDPDLCKRCGICTAVCPVDVFEPEPGGLPRVMHPTLCIWCNRCEIYCPDYAIQLHGRRGF